MPIHACHLVHMIQSTQPTRRLLGYMTSCGSLATQMTALILPHRNISCGCHLIWLILGYVVRSSSVSQSVEWSVAALRASCICSTRRSEWGQTALMRFDGVAHDLHFRQLQSPGDQQSDPDHHSTGWLHRYNRLVTRRRNCTDTTDWHGAGSPGWPFPMLKYQFIFK